MPLPAQGNGSHTDLFLFRRPVFCCAWQTEAARHLGPRHRLLQRRALRPSKGHASSAQQFASSVASVAWTHAMCVCVSASPHTHFCCSAHASTRACAGVCAATSQGNNLVWGRERERDGTYATPHLIIGSHYLAQWCVCVCVCVCVWSMP